MAASQSTAHVEVDVAMGDEGRRVLAMEYATRLVESLQMGTAGRYYSNPGDAAVRHAVTIEAYLKGDPK